VYKIFDIHTHTYPEKIADRAVESLEKFYDFYGDYGFAVAGKGTYADLSSMAEDNNVVGYLLFSVATNPTQVEKVNDSIASLAKKSREEGFQTVGFLGMHQDYPDFEKELIRCEDMGLCGVKIHPDIQGVDIDDPKLIELYKLIEGRMPLYLHMGDDRPQYRFSEAVKLVDILKQFPRLRVVAAHLGGYKAWDDALEHLAGRDNVYYDTSSALWAMTPERAADIISALGAENVMFGTDYPVVNTKEELERFFKINLTDREREDILWNNAIRFLRIGDE